MCVRWHDESMKLGIDENNKLQFANDVGEVKIVLADKELQKRVDDNYDRSGFHTTLTDSRELLPSFKRQDHDGTFQVSVVTGCQDDYPGNAGHHAWLRLTDQKGNVYSIGKFPRKLNLLELVKKYETEFCCADRQEWTAKESHIKETSFTISEDQFNSLKKNIERDVYSSLNIENKAVEQRDWNLIGINCADWSIEKLSEVGIINQEVKDRIVRRSKSSLIETLLPKIYHTFMAKVARHSFLDKAIRGTIRIISRCNYPWKIVLLFLGAGRKNPQNPDSRPLIATPQDFLWGLYEATHPYKLRMNLEKEFPSKKV